MTPHDPQYLLNHRSITHPLPLIKKNEKIWSKIKHVIFNSNVNDSKSSTIIPKNVSKNINSIS